MQVYAVYFAREFKPGEHWHDGTPMASTIHPSDRAQHWKVGDWYSMSSTKPEALPAHFSAKLVEKPDGGVWNPKHLRFDAKEP